MNDQEIKCGDIVTYYGEDRFLDKYFEVGATYKVAKIMRGSEGKALAVLLDWKERATLWVPAQLVSKGKEDVKDSYFD